MRASIKPLAAGGVTGVLVAAVPVIMTALLAARSNRPEVGFSSAAGGSIHPVHLLQFPFADLFGAMNPKVEYWAPQSLIWDAAWGWPGLYLSQNMGQVYAGALPFLALMAFGLIRGVAWAREIRFFTIAAALVLLYALGAYTPAFLLMYDLLPAVALYRRPADATFVLVALVAIIAGYLVHRWLTGTVPPATRLQRALEIACAVILVVTALALAHSVVGIRLAVVPVVTGIVFAGAAIAVLALARRHQCRRADRRGGARRRLHVARSRLEQCAARIDRAAARALRARSARIPATRPCALLKAQLAAAAAPDRRDRVELIGVGYHWPNLSLAHGFDHVFGHNPLRLALVLRGDPCGRHGRGAVAAHVLAALSVLPLGLCRSVRRAFHRHRRAGRADRLPRSSPAISRSSRAPRTPTCTRIRARCRASCC